MTRAFATLDCETDPFDGKTKIEPFIWGIYHEYGYDCFNTTEELISFIKDKEWIIYAHNGGRFDYIFLLQYLNTDENIMLINGRIAKAKIGVAEIRDSYCILPVPLAALNKDEFDYTKMTKANRHKYMKEIKKYLYNDCFYLYQAIDDFIQNYGNGVTIAGTAMKLWNNMKGGKPEKTSKTFFEQFKPYYHGGRVECFESGIIKDHIKLYDINSAYPFAMVHDHAIGNVVINSKSLPHSDKELQRSFITLECEGHGQFPIRTREGTHFPHDEQLYIFNITGWEYITAKKLGLIHNVCLLYTSPSPRDS